MTRSVGIFAKGALHMSSSFALLRLLEQDLRALSEVRDARKFPEVKEAAERALLRLRSISKSLPEDASASVQASRVAEVEEVLVPFMLALASKSDALPLSALGAVQRMISHNAVAPQRLPTVTSQLIARSQLPSADENSLLKVLQTVLTIASSPALLYSDTTVSQLLLLCLTLQQSRSATIKNTASATVQQFVALLLDKCVAEGVPPASTPSADESKPPSAAALAELSVAARCAFMAVQDLCLLANGEPALWLPGSGPVSVPLALEVISRTLQSHTELFIHFAPFRFLLRERACALVLKTMKAPSQVHVHARDVDMYCTHSDDEGALAGVYTLHARMHPCVHAHMHTCMSTHMHAYRHARTMHACTHTCIHARTHAHTTRTRMHTSTHASSTHSFSSQEWGIALRLAHLTSTLLASYASVLRTECEILISMLAKTASSEATPIWQVTGPAALNPG